MHFTATNLQFFCTLYRASQIEEYSNCNLLFILFSTTLHDENRTDYKRLNNRQSASQIELQYLVNKTHNLGWEGVAAGKISVLRVFLPRVTLFPNKKENNVGAGLNYDHQWQPALSTKCHASLLKQDNHRDTLFSEYNFRKLYNHTSKTFISWSVFLKHL